MLKSPKHWVPNMQNAAQTHKKDKTVAEIWPSDLCALKEKGSIILRESVGKWAEILHLF